MFQFIEKGMRRGIYMKSNNRYMKDYNKKAPSKYNVYQVDANNLYS